jgi:F0F1-type ATP synthase membrane subunit c/vacuolar-type H+-ATPase subunit K
VSRSRRRTRRKGLLPAGPRWTLLARGVRRQTRAGVRTARKRRNELAITLLYAVAGALCLALAALLIAPASLEAPTPAVEAATRLPEAAPPVFRATVVGAVVLAAIGVVLFGLAVNSLRLWWQNRT